MDIYTYVLRSCVPVPTLLMLGRHTPRHADKVAADYRYTVALNVRGADNT